MPVAMVTGASRGVGRGVAIALDEAGFQVFATGRSIATANRSTIPAGCRRGFLLAGCPQTWHAQYLAALPVVVASSVLSAHGLDLRTDAIARACRCESCHQKAIISLDAEKKLLEAMGAKAEILDEGCCGMAGSFGFEQHKYDFSMQIFEHRLDPQLREMPSQKLVVADGFRCKTQTEQATGRHPLHLAQLVRIAQRGNEADHRRDEIKKGKAFDNSKLIRNGALLLGRPKCCARDLASRAEDFSMKSKKLNSGTVLILDTRDEVVSRLTKFAKEHRVAAAHFMAVGAFSDAGIGYFDLDKKD